MPVYCSDFTKIFTIWFYFQFPENIDEKQLLSMESVCLKEQNELAYFYHHSSRHFQLSELIIISKNTVVWHTPFLPPGISSTLAIQKCGQLDFV